MILPDGRTFNIMVATGTEGCYFDAEGNLLFVRKIRRVIGKQHRDNNLCTPCNRCKRWPCEVARLRGFKKHYWAPEDHDRPFLGVKAADVFRGHPYKWVGGQR